MHLISLVACSAVQQHQRDDCNPCLLHLHVIPLRRRSLGCTAEFSISKEMMQPLSNAACVSSLWSRSPTFQSVVDHCLSRRSQNAAALSRSHITPPVPRGLAAPAAPRPPEEGEGEGGGEGGGGGGGEDGGGEEGRLRPPPPVCPVGEAAAAAAAAAVACRNSRKKEGGRVPVSLSLSQNSCLPVLCPQNHCSSAPTGAQGHRILTRSTFCQSSLVAPVGGRPAGDRL